MKQDFKLSLEIAVNNNSEFRLGTDNFEAARHKGLKYWIIKHIFYKGNKILVILFTSLSIFAACLSSLKMVIIGMALDSFNQGNSDQILYFTLILLLIGVGTPSFGLIARIFRETLAQRLERDTRKEFYLNLLGKSQSFHDSQRLGDIMARATNDVRLLNFLISPAISMLFDAFVNIIIPIVLCIYFYSIQLIIIPISFTLIFVFYLRIFLRKLGPATRQRRIEFGNMNTVLNESLSGIEIVKSMAQEKHSIEKYRESAINYRDWGIKMGDIQARYLPILFISITITLGLTHGIFLFQAGLMSLGELLGYVGLLFHLRFPVYVSINSFLLIQQASAGAERLLETMNEKSEIKEIPEAITRQIKGKIKFDNVSFSYPRNKNKVLSDINFEIKPGSTVAIVGMTGSGKSTLTKLISRLYDVSKGHILIDDVDIRDYSLQSLRDQIAYIEQDVFVFSKSVLDNIAFGRDRLKDDIIAVAKEAQAHEFIINLPQQYDTEVGERGVQLSGGERQRIAIARAFLSDPKILILDDSSSAIDSETEERIQTAISRILKNKTTLIITHRLSQIRAADHILVLKQGQVIEQGSHEYLLQNSEEYRKIFVKRFDKTLEELLGGN